MGGGRPNLKLSPGPGLWSLVLEPFGPDLGPDLDLTDLGPGPELDNTFIFLKFVASKTEIMDTQTQIHTKIY